MEISGAVFDYYAGKLRDLRAEAEEHGDSRTVIVRPDGSQVPVHDADAAVEFFLDEHPELSQFVKGATANLIFGVTEYLKKNA